MDAVKNSKISRLSVLRRVTQLLIIFLLFVTPVLGFIRLDGKNDSLLFFGFRIFLNSVSVYEVTLAISFIVITGYLVYLLFGRAWCGFFCPQLSVYEFRDYIIKIISNLFNRKNALQSKPKARSVVFRKASVYLFIGALSAILTFSVSSYFIDFGARGAFNIENIVYPLLVVFPLFILDLTVLRPKMCDYCLYGYVQSSISDENSIGISYKPSGTACKTCSNCKDVCPQDFDPRNTHFRTCFNCAKCVDACPEGFIKFGFGKEDGKLSFLNYKTGFIAATLIAIVILMFLAPFRAGKIRFTAANYNLYHYWNYNSPLMKGYVLNKFVINATNFTDKEIKVKPVINSAFFSSHQFLKGKAPYAVLKAHGKGRFVFYAGVKKGALSSGVHDFKLSLVSPKNGKPYETNTVSIYIPSKAGSGV